MTVTNNLYWQVVAPHMLSVRLSHDVSGEPRDESGKWTAGSSGKSGAVAEEYRPSVKIKLARQRAFNGKQVAVRNPLSKQAAGKLGEDIIIAHLQSLGMTDARPMNLDRNNFPVDMIQDHEAIEGKTGQAGNGKSAQQWRLTIGEPGNSEKEALRKMTAEQKKAWNAEKQRKIHERKAKVLKEFGESIGHEIKAATLTVIINPDTKTADIYRFEGWHDRVGWNSSQAQKGYVRSVHYE